MKKERDLRNRLNETEEKQIAGLIENGSFTETEISRFALIGNGNKKLIPDVEDDIEYLKCKCEEFAEKGYEIDAGMVSSGVTVFYEGEEIFFYTEKEAKEFIDKITEG